ncbi:hypothetical protein DQ237_09895 [Blastococcus sp. TF02-8]|nr:hypothetical protein DQ237_09895 [Blastococcus sp. TF02-8]
MAGPAAGVGVAATGVGVITGAGVVGAAVEGSGDALGLGAVVDVAAVRGAASAGASSPHPLRTAAASSGSATERRREIMAAR